MLVFVVVSLLAQTTPESDFTVTLTADNAGVVIVRYNGSASVVRIPPTIQGIPVREISGRGTGHNMVGAFQNNNTITSVVIPEGVISISDGGSHGSFSGGVFLNCTRLATVTLPSTLTRVGNYAFSGCSSLQTIIIPTGVTAIGHGAFERCTALRNVTLSSGLISIGDRAFQKCTALQNISLPNTITSIGQNAFMECSSLQSINLPDSLTRIDRGAFWDSGLTSIKWPASVTVINGRMFNGCKNLRTVDIPVGVTVLEGDQGSSGLTSSSPVAGPFAGCSSLTSIILPEGLTTIGATSFAGTSITSINLPSTIRRIGHYAFGNNPSLTTVTIPESVQQIVFESDNTTYSIVRTFAGSPNINLMSQAVLRRVGFRGEF